jgi:hypothetical protein
LRVSSGNRRTRCRKRRVALEDSGIRGIRKASGYGLRTTGDGRPS